MSCAFKYKLLSTVPISSFPLNWPHNEWKHHVQTPRPRVTKAKDWSWLIFFSNSGMSSRVFKISADILRCIYVGTHLCSPTHTHTHVHTQSIWGHGSPCRGEGMSFPLQHHGIICQGTVVQALGIVHTVWQLFNWLTGKQFVFFFFYSSPGCYSSLTLR